jgi:hypothetical protein
MLRTAVALIVFASLFSAVGLASSLDRQDVTVSLDKDGNAKVAEEYIVRLDTSEYADFDNASRTGLSDLWRWERFIERNTVVVLGERDSLAVIGKRDQLGFGHVTVTYSIPNFAKQLKEEGRIVTRGLTGEQFALYNAVGKLLIIPAKTTLQIQLDDIRKDPREDPGKYVEVSPPGIDINTGRPVMISNRITCTWRGPFAAGNFSLEFQIEKGLAESWGFEKMLAYLGDAFMKNPIYTVAVLIVVVLVAIYRREILGLIAESFAGEERVERPKKEIR